MNKPILILFLSFFSLSIFAQTHQFVPNWKKGETKTMTRILIEQDYIEGELNKEESDTATAVFTILADSKESVTMQILQANLAMASAREMSENIEEALPEYAQLPVIIKVDKKTGERTLENWEEHKKMYEEGIGKIGEILVKEDPDVAGYLDLMLTPFESLYESEESLLGSIETEYGFLFIPFSHEYTIGKTIEIEESTENPLNPSMQIGSLTKLKLESLDEKSGMAKIEQEVILDMSEFVKMIKGLMMSMGETMGVEDSTMEKQKKEMEEFSMDMTNVQTIEYNTKSSWPEKVSVLARLEGYDPKEGKRLTLITSVIDLK